MDITDCPHRAGTPEHSEWVRNVYIPGYATPPTGSAVSVAAVSVARDYCW